MKKKEEGSMNFRIQLIGVEPIYKENPNIVLNHYGIIFHRYNQYLEDNNENDFVSFLKDITNKESKYNDPYLSDFIKDSKFDLLNFVGFYHGGEYDVSLIDNTNDNIKLKLHGSFVIDNKYFLHFCSSYIYIEEIKTRKQYMYYCD